MLREEALRKSRRELRRERERARGGLARRMVGRRASKSKPLSTGDLLREDGLPRSRRALREFHEQRRKRKLRGGVGEILGTILVAFVLVFGLVRPFVVEAYRIPSESMVPTLEVGDRVLANKFVYNFSEPERGDVVIFENVEGGDETLIKRVVGVAGDRIRVMDGRLRVDNKPQEEPYVNESSPPREDFGPETVPKGHVFVMGDNRGNSGDSRLFGPVPLENVKGEAFVRFWPIPKIEPFFGDPERGAS